MTEAEKAELARVVGLRDFRTPKLEDVDRRRSQLWLLSLLVGLAVPGAIVALGFDSLNRVFSDLVDVRLVRLVLLALLVALFGYVTEREVALRRLSRMLVDERVLTATLVARIADLDALLEASRAMNSSLQLSKVLDVILRSACGLLDARAGSIQLVRDDDPGTLAVAAVHGESTAKIGQHQTVGEGVAGGAAASGEAVLVTGPQKGNRSGVLVESALVVPLFNRGALLGVLNLSAPKTGEAFNEFQLRSVAVFAETAAAAIANARAHERTEERVATLTELDELKDEFLQLVTHELRTPLTSLIGLASTLAKRADHFDAEQVRHFSEIMGSQGWRLERLVSDLLKSAEAQRGVLTLEPVEQDVGALVTETVRVFRENAPRHMIGLETPDEPLVHAVDADATTRIVTNLLSNAVKYSPEGATVHVRVEPHPRGVMLSVTDEGPGIPEGEREALFTKFRRGSMVGSARGLGLGLYIVRSLAEAHGGEASVRASASGGSEFVVVLAVADGARNAVDDASRQEITG